MHYIGELGIRDSFRFIKRDGKLILQICFIDYVKGNPVRVWQDVPVVEEVKTNEYYNE